MIAIECPYCAKGTSGNPCESCDKDVSVYLSIRATAERAYAEAWSHAREERIPEAISRISVATILYDDERFRRLAGWLHFLLGDAMAAMHYWNEVPEEAARATKSFNAALSLAKEGKRNSALEKISSIGVPLQPARRLERAISDKAATTVRERQLIARSNVLWRPPAIGAAAVILLLVGTLLGYGLTGSDETSTTSQSPERRAAPAVAAPAEREQQPESTNEDLLRAFVTNQPDEVYERSSVDRLPSSPVPSIREQIPVHVRREAALGWYRRGHRAFGSGDYGRAQRNLLASLATTGLEGDEYWIDDALYFLALSLRERVEVERAETVATLLVRTHPGSMYVNSNIRALLPSEGDSPQ